jgi:hypothetical protein
MYPDPNSSSQKMYDRALASLPGGNIAIGPGRDAPAALVGLGRVTFLAATGSEQEGYTEQPGRNRPHAPVTPASTTAAKFASDEFSPSRWSFAEIPGGT